MSAVKNLRAMFEQKGEVSPPERGRSPGVPLGKAIPSGFANKKNLRPAGRAVELRGALLPCDCC